MSEQVEVTVWTDNNQSTTVEVSNDEANEYERMVGKSPNVVRVTVK